MDLDVGELGVQPGAGYIFPFKKASMAIDVRYGYGLTDRSRDVERYKRVLNISVLTSPGRRTRLESRGNLFVVITATHPTN